VSATVPASRCAGLRFNRASIRVFRNLIDELERTRPRGIDVGLYRKALESVEANEPLVVHFDHPDEIEQMADGFTALGIARPAIDPLD
jgi:hypothetical protein